MSSTILYKFRSGQNFEALPLPGSAARLYDVKRAIVQAKRLDVQTSGNSSGAIEFDLSVRDASTNQEYVDESMVLPRGTRVIVQRLPAARGHGFLARMAKTQAGMMTAGSNAAVAQAAAPSGFYTIQSRAHDDEDEFVSTNPAAAATTTTTTTGEDSEIAALMAVTDAGAAAGASTSGGYRVPPASTMNQTRIAGSGPPPPRPSSSHFSSYAHHNNRPPRPNADPELQHLHQQPVVKKRATGIPRTFLNLSAPPVTDGTVTGEKGGIGGGQDEQSRLLQPNVMGFEELVHRGGGQSEMTKGTKRDLDYALKLTGTDIPEHLQCGICHNVVQNAMLLPWDVEGRTACETCIRNALSNSGFRCPLTGMEGVSPDDLHPNHGLRKAAELFIKGVMEKMDEIERQAQEAAEEPDVEESETAASAATTLEGDSGDKGVIVSRRTMKDHKRKHDDDPFGGGDDDFGGDVFDVAPTEVDEDNAEDEKNGGGDKVETQGTDNEMTASDAASKANEGKDEVEMAETKDTDEHSKANRPNQSSDKSGDADDDVRDRSSPASKARDGSGAGSTAMSPHSAAATPGTSSAEDNKRTARRGPPAGYVMGPAGGAAVRGARKSPEVDRTSASNAAAAVVNGPRDGVGSPYAGRGGRGSRGGDYFGGRAGGRGGRFGGAGRFEGRGGAGRGYPQPQEDHYSGDAEDDIRSRGSKHSRSESEDHVGEQQQHDRYRPGRGRGRGWGLGGGSGAPPSRGGRFPSRAPPPYGGRFDGSVRGGYNGSVRGGFDGGRGGGPPPPYHPRGGGRGGRGTPPPFRGGRGGYRGRGRY